MAKIEIEKFYPFPPELVWDALTDRQAMAQWLMENDFEPKVGHRFQFRAKEAKGWRGYVDCEVLAATKPSLLSYSWVGDESIPATTVTWRLEASPGGTTLRLSHTGFAGMKGFLVSKLILGPGWKKMMNRLVPVVLAHMKEHGRHFPAGTRLVDNSCHA